MKLHTSYITNERLKLFSSRLKHVAYEQPLYQTYIDHRIKTEDLKYNLSLILAHIILNLKLIDRSKSVLIEIINDYNDNNKTDLSFVSFEQIVWIRTINDEIKISELVRHYLWEIDYTQGQGKPIEIPKDKEHIIKCLKIFYDKCYEDPKHIIDKDILINVLAKFGNNINIEFLEENKILEFDNDNDSYIWINNEYKRYLRNEISSTLWLLICGEESNEIQFRLFIKYLDQLEIWPDNLDLFLSSQNTSKICELSFTILNKEFDLDNSDFEFKKIWFDSRLFTHATIESEIPQIKFTGTTSPELIEEIEYYKWRFREIFDHQETRDIYNLLIRFVIQYDENKANPFQRVFSLLSNPGKPFIVWNIYTLIPKNFPGVIPYLINESEFAAIAFKLIDKLEINPVYLPYAGTNDETFLNKLKFINALWLELFEITLEQLSSLSHLTTEIGEIIGNILLDTSKKVYNFNSFGRHSLSYHQTYKKRFDGLFKLLNGKLTSSIKYHNFLILIFPSLFEFLKNKKSFSPHLEFLVLDYPSIDLFINLFKSINNEPISKDYIVFLKEKFLEYFTLNEISVASYSTSGLEKRKVKRGVGDFGFELIDWSYLYLNFQNYNLIDKVDSRIISSISLDAQTAEGIYSADNKEQLEKIKTYLKSLLRSYLGIQNNRESLELFNLPVEETLKKLSVLILKYSQRYSIDDLKNNRINAFNENFILLHSNIYHQSMYHLLYKSLNFYSIDLSKKFISEFFKNSIDIGEMLSAVNTLDSKELKDLISDRISQIDIEEFIKSRFTIIEIENALIESINSEDYWLQFTEPLMEQIQKHYSGREDKDSQKLLFEVNLLFAFKKKDFDKLESITVPKLEFGVSNQSEENENRKIFFIALYKLYNDNDFDVAISELESLLIKEPKNINYAFHLYKARTLKALNE